MLSLLVGMSAFAAEPLFAGAVMSTDSETIAMPADLAQATLPKGAVAIVAPKPAPDGVWPQEMLWVRPSLVALMRAPAVVPPKAAEKPVARRPGRYVDTESWVDMRATVDASGAVTAVRATLHAEEYGRMAVEENTEWWVRYDARGRATQMVGIGRIDEGGGSWRRRERVDLTWGEDDHLTSAVFLRCSDDAENTCYQNGVVRVDDRRM
jgi:hypothetical protein